MQDLFSECYLYITGKPLNSFDKFIDSVSLQNRNIFIDILNLVSIFKGINKRYIYYGGYRNKKTFELLKDHPIIGFSKLDSGSIVYFNKTKLSKKTINNIPQLFNNMENNEIKIGKLLGFIEPMNLNSKNRIGGLNFTIFIDNKIPIPYFMGQIVSNKTSLLDIKNYANQYNELLQEISPRLTLNRFDIQWMD